MNTQKENKINDILNSLDGCTRATPKDFFYTRLRARMESGDSPVSTPSLILRPVYVFSGLLAILLINILVVYNRSTVTNDSTSAVETESIQSLAAEYRLNDNTTTLYDLNQDK